jgi:hypothetical protein
VAPEAAVTTGRGRIIVAFLGGLAVALIVLELALGALSFGEPHLADPCTARLVSTGSGFSAVVERLARATLDGAACKLHTTREELVLSFVPAAGTKRIRWNRQTIDSALRAGLDRAAHEVAGNGLAGSVLAFTLGKVFAPSVEWFLQQLR